MSSTGQGRFTPPRGPKPLSEILNALFAARGLGRLQARVDLELAWSTAVGEVGQRQTRVDALKNGVLSVTVAHSTLLEELRSFQKSRLLESLRRSLPDENLNDIRFRVGSLTQPTPVPDQAPARASSASNRRPSGSTKVSETTNVRPPQVDAPTTSTKRSPTSRRKPGNGSSNV